ncbi:MAG TPA: hypothetical protein VEY67_09795 [Candidatus Dormibacteraeota bacterium]|nr:hypothetical protein [Candidatus Dormibacteraeota bacterium]
MSRHDDLRLFLAHDRRAADLRRASDARLRAEASDRAQARVRIGRLVIRLGERLASGATLETAGPC